MGTYVRALLFLALFCGIAHGQIDPHASDHSGTAPIYHLTVVGRTIQAVNYGHREVPTKIDFRGTVLEPKARGEATVESRRGATVIEAKIEHLPTAQKFGLEYLTYVLWAITPEGRAVSLGEVVLDPSDKAKLHVTTGFPAFGLLITAEPYYSVTQPSDVVVMENAVRPDTIGKIEVVEANFELLPRGRFSFDEQAAVVPAQGKKVRMNEYEAIAAVYQAQNAIQIAQSQGAEHHANEVFSKAVALFEQAQSYKETKDFKRAVMTAREAAQTAEDARAIAEKRTENQIERVQLGSAR